MSDVQSLINKLKELDLKSKQINKERQQVIAQLEEATVTEGIQTDPRFEPGDRVKVRNGVQRPGNASASWTREKEEHGTVLKYDREKEKVWYINDNGTRTWRLEKNLEKL